MKRVFQRLGSVALALVLLYVGVRIYNDVDLRGSVYTIAQVRMGLRTHPRAWVGRSVLVRGFISEQGFDRECVPSVCQATLFYEELGEQAVMSAPLPAGVSRVLHPRPGMPLFVRRPLRGVSVGVPPGVSGRFIVEIPWYHYPGALRLVAEENGGTIQSLPGPLRRVAVGLLDPPLPRTATIQRIRLLAPGHCPTFTTACPVAVLEH